MQRRTFLQTAAASLLQAQPTKRPNLLLLMSDQHRGDCLGIAGHPVVQTPNLDRLARGGAYFPRAYSSTPTCTPARAALLTGMSPWSHGLLGYGQIAAKYPVEMPQLLRDAGYETLGIGKMHWTPQRALHGFHRTILDESGREESPGYRSDYRSWLFSEAPLANPEPTGIDWNGYAAKPWPLEERLHPTAWAADTAIHFLEQADTAKPWFLKVSMERPHSPYDPPARWFEHYMSQRLPMPAVGKWAEKYRPKSGDVVNLWHGELDGETTRRARAGYFGAVSFVDEQMGRIVKQLEKQGQLENTCIIFTADHGDMLGDHFLWRKSYAYEPSTRIPMIVHWPDGGFHGRVLRNPVEIRDVLPTLLEAAGISVPALVEGKSLLGPAKNPAAPWRKWIDLEHDVCYSPDNHWNALTDGTWKYIFHARTGREQLFHLRDDPFEVTERSDVRELVDWRTRMVNHLSVRGPAWVRDGKLMLRPESELYSPNYPRPPRSSG